ncbi:MAG TPA: tetratricopeptide repeat protein [bacterium]|nr:tetratricopeptide repeat protein [bacterium]
MKKLVFNAIDRHGRMEEKDKAALAPKLNAAHALTGGNPRMAAFMADIVCCENVEPMLDFMMKLIDEITPYYDAVFKDVPEHQRNILDVLAEYEPAQSPADIASKLETGSEVIRNYLIPLKDNGYVRLAFSDGRSNYYCLNEYLYRIFRQTRGGHPRDRDRWVIEWLFLLYSFDEISAMRDNVSQGVVRVRDTNVMKKLLSEAVEYRKANPVDCDNIEMIKRMAAGTSDKAEKTEPTMTLVIEHIKKKEFEQALEEMLIMEQEDENHTNNAMFNYVRATCLFCLGRHQEAIESFELAAGQDSDAHRIFSGWGSNLIALNRYEEAIEKFEIAARINPEDHSIYSGWGHSLVALKKYKEAAEKFETAARLNSDDYMTYSGWGHSLKVLNMNEEAIEKFEIAARLNPGDYLSYSGWGHSLAALNRHEEAIEKFETTARLNPDDYMTYSSWGRSLMALNRHEEASDKFEIAARINPKDFLIYTGWGRSLMALNRNIEAMEKFETAARLNPDEYLIYLVWGNSLAALIKHKEAMEKFETAARLNSDEYLIYLVWGNSLAALIRHEEAVEKFENAARLNSDDYMTYSGWGHSLAALNRHEEAIEKFETTARLNPDDYMTYSSWGRSLMALNRHEEAAGKFEIAEKLNSDFNNFTDLALCQIQMERYDEATLSLIRAYNLETRITISGMLEETAAKLNPEEYIRMFYSKVEGERFTDEELCALLAATDRFEAATDCLANLREKYLVKKENNKKDLTLLTGLLKMQLFTKLARGKGAEALRVVDLIVAALKYYGENNKDDKNEKEEEIRLITFRVILLHAAGKSTEKDSVNVIARFKEARNDGLPWSESLEIVFKCITEPKTLEAKKAMADKAIRAIVKIIRKQAKELEFAEI